MAGYLNKYTAALGSNPSDFADGSYPTDFDWKYGDTADDLFQVGNQWLRADQFGNFAAGYAGQKVFGDLGHLAMVVGGIVVASQKDSGEHWFDGNSRPMINAGAGRARLEQGPSHLQALNLFTPSDGVTPLTSTTGCK